MAILGSQALAADTRSVSIMQGGAPESKLSWLLSLGNTRSFRGHISFLLMVTSTNVSIGKYPLVNPSAAISEY